MGFRMRGLKGGEGVLKVAGKKVALPMRGW
jgi:hypothetical protein